MAEELFQVGIKALIINSRKQVLVLRSNPKGPGFPAPDHWDLPGGRIDEGESILQALRREIHEELGIRGSRVWITELFDIGPSRLMAHAKHRLMLVTYRCKMSGANNFRISKEHTEYKWAGKKEAKKLLKTKFPQSFLLALDKL